MKSKRHIKNNMKEDNKSNISKNIIIVVACAIIIIMATVLYFQNTGDAKTSTFDSSFEMIDPENPESSADEIIRIRREFNKFKSEKIIIEEVLGQIGFSDSSENSLLKDVKSGIPERTYSENTDTQNEDLYQYSGARIKPPQNNNTPVYLSEEMINFLSSLEPNQIYSFHIDKYMSNGNIPISNNGYAVNDYINTKAYVQCDQAYKKYHLQFNSLLSKYHISIQKSYGRNVVFYDMYNYRYPIYKDKKNTTPTPAELGKFIDNASKQLSFLGKQLNKRSDSLDVLIKNYVNDYNKKVDEYRNSRLDINDKAIKYGIIAFCVTALTMYIAGLVYRSKLRKPGDGKSEAQHQEEFKVSAWYSVYMITVLLLIITIFILGLAKLLSENSLAALLGGIAGYVLNNKMGDSSQQANTTASVQNNTPQQTE
ncbi:MAG: hypothetical protein JNJ40_18185 [Bacteroidia bacterium]|nr:hypothetical protein [Bacteroidia bacterium]